MAIFRVGQRVKKVRGERNVGLTGVVVAVGRIPAGSSLHPGYVVKKERDLAVKYDSLWTNASGQIAPPEVVAACRSEQFEPIQPEGHKVVSWSECLWAPPEMREKA